MPELCIADTGINERNVLKSCKPQDQIRSKDQAQLGPACPALARAEPFANRMSQKRQILADVCPDAGIICSFTHTVVSGHAVRHLREAGSLKGK